MESAIKDAMWEDPVYISAYVDDFDDFNAYWSKTSPPADAGYSGRLGSRLLDEEALTGDFDDLKAALRKTTPAPWNLLGHLVAGPGTHSPPNGIPGGSNAVGPGWRKAYAHIGERLIRTSSKGTTDIKRTVLPRIWTPLNETEKKSVTTDLRDTRTEALRQLAPNTGAFVNEVDPTEPDWQNTLYGDNYPPLLEAKEKWDPRGVFWCKHCVGSELWDAVGPYGIENGVGQSQVKLCRK
jgi:hypothetical protein